MSSSPPGPKPSTTATVLEPTLATATIPQPASSLSLSVPTSLSDIANHDESSQTFPALTTHWTTPQSCTWTYVVDRSQQSPPTSGAVAWLDLEPIPGASTLSCYPDGMFFGSKTGTFSPATCPNGWTTVSLMVNTDETVTKQTTTALCCSSEYSLEGRHCKRSIPTVLAVPITYNDSASTYDVMTNFTTTLYSATVAVNTIQALFCQEDKTYLGITDETQISEHGTPSHGLSLGARIGIGIGATVFGLIIGGAVLFLFLRKRRPSGQSSHELNAMRARRANGSDVYGSGQPPLRPSVTHEAEPPPAYDIATETNSIADNESGNGSTREDEMRALVAQKAAIQRRIEELARAEADDPQEHARNEQ